MLEGIIAGIVILIIFCLSEQQPKFPPGSGYQPTSGNLDSSNPPSSGSGVPSKR